ncbi:MAG: hypothetical protein U5K76_05355 [Woeseiaceae bacterium]|nr:hypothetical protein [Woeseiaceae bacterium]
MIRDTVVLRNPRSGPGLVAGFDPAMTSVDIDAARALQLKPVPLVAMDARRAAACA